VSKTDKETDKRIEKSGSGHALFMKKVLNLTKAASSLLIVCQLNPIFNKHGEHTGICCVAPGRA